VWTEFGGKFKNMLFIRIVVLENNDHEGPLNYRLRVSSSNIDEECSCEYFGVVQYVDSLVDSGLLMTLPDLQSITLDEQDFSLEVEFL